MADFKLPMKPNWLRSWEELPDSTLLGNVFTLQKQ